MFISGKPDVYTENGVVYMEAKLPKVMGKHTLKMALHTPVEVNDVINALVKAKNEAFESGGEVHKKEMEMLHVSPVDSLKKRVDGTDWTEE